MKLYYSPGACSLAPHIALCEAGAEFELVRVDLRAKEIKAGAGSDYRKINPLGKVPALDIGEPEVLTENVAILSYIADKFPAAWGGPKDGNARYRLLRWLGFVTSEMHKGFVPVFHAAAYGESGKAAAIQNLGNQFAFLNSELGTRDYLLDGHFSVADCYLSVVLGWTAHAGIDMSGYTNLGAYSARIAARPSVIAARKAEGLPG